MLLPIWREAFMGAEWLSLRTKPVYYGYGVPHGNGSAVITVPGFLGSDFYLTEMNRWLKRIGYRAYPSGIGRNAECPDIFVDRLLDTVKRSYGETGERGHVVGAGSTDSWGHMESCKPVEATATLFWSSRWSRGRRLHRHRTAR